MNGTVNPSFKPDNEKDNEKDAVYDDVTLEDTENSGGGYEVPLNLTDAYSSINTAQDGVPDIPPPLPPNSSDADSSNSQNTEGRFSRGSSGTVSAGRASIRRNTSIRFADKNDIFDSDKQSTIADSTDGHRVDVSEEGSGVSLDPPSLHGGTSQRCFALKSFVKRHQSTLWTIGKILIHCAVVAFSVVAGMVWLTEHKPLTYCSGFGQLLIILALVYGTLLCRRISPYFSSMGTSARKYFKEKLTKRGQRWFGYIITTVITLILLVLLLVDMRSEPRRLVSFLGAVVLISLGYIFSSHPGQVKWKPVINGLLIQLVLGLLTVRWATGREILQCLADKVVSVLSCGVEGAKFVFGPDLEAKKTLAFSALPIIFFIGSLIQVLYYMGWAQRFLVWFGNIIGKGMGTTPVESVNSITTTLLGQSESALLIQPYIKDLTASEMHAVMSAGLATTGGMLFAAYVNCGADPAHLVTSSMLSAPAALCFSKLFYPETEATRTSGDMIVKQTSDDTSVLDSLSKGAQNGISIVLNIIANVVAFVSMVRLANNALGFLGEVVGYPNLELELIFSKVFIPLAWLMGVQADQCASVATLIGFKTIVNEYVAFQKLGEMKLSGLLSKRSEAIATYAICGFANPGSVGISISALTAMAPTRRETICRVSIRAFITGSVACFLTACMADCIGCDTQLWQEEIIPNETWQEICMTPNKLAHQHSILPSSNSDIPTSKEQTHSQYLQIGYRHSKQNWSTKAINKFNNIIRRRNSTAHTTSSTESREFSEPFIGPEPRAEADPSEDEWPSVAAAETQSKGEKEVSTSCPEEQRDKVNQESKICIRNEVNEDVVEPTESGVGVLTLMQLQYRQFKDRAVSVHTHTRAASDQILSLKCCCSDADLTKPSMCGDRAYVSCSLHDHRLIARQVSMAAEAAANAAASVLAVPAIQTDHRDAQQTPYSSVTTIPGNADVHGVLHSVRSALEYRQRLFRPEPIVRSSVSSQTINAKNTEFATCTTPSNEDATVKPILHTLGKMYQKHLFISALFHNMTATDVKKIDYKINDCRTKIEELQDVCKQQKTPLVTSEKAVGDEFLSREKEKPITVDAGVGEEEVCEKKTGPVITDTAVGGEEVKTVDKETQDVVEIAKMIDRHTDPVIFHVAVEDVGVGEEKVDKEEIVETIDEYTARTSLKVETGIQAERDEGVGVPEVVEVGVQVMGDENVGEIMEDTRTVDSLASEDPWRQLSQLSDLSSADIHSLNYYKPHLLEAYLLQLENSPKTEKSVSIPDIQLGSSAEYIRRAAAASVSKVKSMSMQKYRLCKPVKVPARSSVQRSTSSLHQNPGRYRTLQDRQKNKSPQRLGIPSLAVQTHPIANPNRTIAASARFAGGRSGMNNFTLRRGAAPINKQSTMKFVSTTTINKPTPRN